MSLLVWVHDLERSADLQREKREVHIACTNCQSALTQRSKPKGLLESVFLALIFVRPFRCEDCDSRFLRWSISEEPGPERPTRTS